MKKTIFLFFSLISNFIYAQQQDSGDFMEFKKFVFNIFEDTTNHWSEYPKPPGVTDDVLLGMKGEINSDDSAKIYLEKLSFKNFKSAVDYEKALQYFNKVDYEYTLLGLATHWNPDLRVYALKQLNKKIMIRPLINSVKMKNGEWKKYNKIAIEFLIYLLESNPLFINGSENATIHSFYISNILWNLDLLTGENIVGKKSLSEWYKNDLQFETALIRWKSYVK